MVPEEGLEPSRGIPAPDFKSGVSAIPPLWLRKGLYSSDMFGEYQVVILLHGITLFCD